MYKPTANYTLALVDNNRSSYIDTSSSLASKAEAYVAVSDSGKGNSSARRVLVGVDKAVPGSIVPLSFRLTVVVPTGATEAVSDGTIAVQALLLLKTLTGFTEDGANRVFTEEAYAAAVQNAVKGILTLD